MKLILLGLLLITSMGLKAQIFTVVEIDKEDLKKSILYGFSPDKNLVDPLHKIVLKADSSDKVKLTYPILIHSKNIDTLSLIKELLSFEGDKRICALPIRNYNPLSSQIYMGKLKRYSIQLEALFIINQLYCAEPYKYSPYPILVDNVGGEESIEGELINDAYKCYKAWFKKVKKIGLKKAKSKDMNPLYKSSTIKWYHTR